MNKEPLSRVPQDDIVADSVLEYVEYGGQCNCRRGDLYKERVADGKLCHVSGKLKDLVSDRHGDIRREELEDIGDVVDGNGRIKQPG